LPLKGPIIKKPITHCYWVVPGSLLAGEYPGNANPEEAKLKIDSMLKSGISVFINLTEEKELIPYDHLLSGASHYRFGIRDVSIPRSAEFTVSVLDEIDRHIETGQKVYIHCWGGVGRTGVIVGCWLVRHGHTGKQALNRLQELWQDCPKSAWKPSPETVQQEQYILNWEKGR